MLIHVQVKANCRTDAIEATNDGTIYVKLRAVPINGKANKYLVEYLSTVFNISKSKIKLIKGHQGSYKTIELQVDQDAANVILRSLQK